MIGLLNLVPRTHKAKDSSNLHVRPHIHMFRLSKKAESQHRITDS